MELDCYWVKPGESKSAPLDFDPPLCFENKHDWKGRRHGRAEFRTARTFEVALQQITGVPLRDRLDGATVLKMADRLEVFAAKPWPLPPTDRSELGWEAFRPEVYRDIGRLFRSCAEAGYELHGSW